MDFVKASTTVNTLAAQFHLSAFHRKSFNRRLELGTILINQMLLNYDYIHEWMGQLRNTSYLLMKKSPIHQQSRCVIRDLFLEVFFT